MAVKLLPAMLVLASSMALSAQTPQTVMNERYFGYRLTPIPDAEGFAGAFAGVSSEALIVAGGANITGDKWSEPLTKKWYDSAFVLEKPEGVWKTGFKLPRPLGYGVSITAEDSVWCFGGSDATRHYTDCFRLQWHQGELRTLPLPPMPRACANACGALVGRMIYIAGGIETPASTEALHSFWSLDLDAPEPIWHELDAWPGPGRMLATAGAYDGSFYLFSGAALSAGPDGKPVREYLRDAYRFTPGVGWKRLADLPRAAVAAPSPSPMVHALGTPSLLVISGDDGLNVTFQPVEKHPGFPLGSLRYDPVHDAWTAYAFPEISRATAPTVSWQNQIIIPNGEVRPRVRTPEVLGFVFPEAK